MDDMMKEKRIWMPSGKDPAPCFCEKIAIVSFTEHGYELSLRMREAFAEVQGVNFLETMQPESGDSKSTGAGKLPQVGLYTARKAVAAAHPEAAYTEGGLSAWCGRQFSDRETDAILFIGACGIAVRTIAPFLVSKTCDPAVLVSDENGNHIISLLSGHLGGGNELAVWLAGKLGADPVITTASDTQGLPAIDLLAKKNQLVIADMELAKDAAAELVNGKKVLLCCSGGVEGEIPAGFLLPEDKEGVSCVGTASEHGGKSGEEPGGFPAGAAPIGKGSAGELLEEPGGLPTGADFTGKESVGKLLEDPNGLPARAAFTGKEPTVGTEEMPASCVSEYKLWISPKTDFSDPAHTLALVPRCLILGIGCKRGKTVQELYGYVRVLFEEQHLSLFAVGTLASASRKADEPGLLALAGLLGAEFVTFSPEELGAVPGEFTSSEFVRQTIGADNVCERAAVAALPQEEQASAIFLCRKTAGNGITAAVVEQKWGITFE